MQIDDTQYWFDPGDVKYKAPYGAVPSGTSVRFTLRPKRAGSFVRATLTARWEFDADRSTQLSLPWTGLDGEYDLFSADLELGDYVGLIWYSLRLERWDGSGVDTPLYQLTVYDGRESVPGWFGEGVSYQIFPDRFCRLTVPDPAGMVGGRTVHQGWEEEPEYRPDKKGEIRNRDFFGGSLPGVTEKLPYLKALGVETLYFCPIFEAPENHRYGAADYEKIDPMLGTGEDFTRLCQKAHELGMRVMLDGVFNHTAFVSRYFNGDGFYPGPGACQSESSPYRDWFCFQHWPDRYISWWGIYSLPTTNKSSESWLSYITGENGIIRSWLRAGADGWRLDVADELPDSVVHAIHTAARAEKDDAVIIGEVWEDASNKIAYDVRRHHVLGGHCDGVMNYPLRSALIRFLLGGDGAWFQTDMERQRQNYPRWAFYSAMNSLGTHDTLRILTLLGEGSDRKDDTSRDWRAGSRLTPEQRALAARRLRLGSLLLYAFPGSPTLYYGDEAGMEGFEDPFNRRTYPWGREDKAMIAWFTALGKARGELAPLRRGELEWLECRGRTVSFLRRLGAERIVAAVNAGERPAAVELPDGQRLRLEPMEGKLLRWEEERLTELLGA
ncbi:glycoside hydrolase family 13 protein [Vermiculatibacterium agrestimuris]|uniref:glycoside hydrolase family 13 protein n=1 Tax=Vermiculatibacterium agrestimuris TaxID=2941519 RepID=UPI00203D509E|nr:glycoside hydrolase family 13 protein [Vermiculatibacterium agrestimuris]